MAGNSSTFCARDRCGVYFHSCANVGRGRRAATAWGRECELSWYVGGRRDPVPQLWCGGGDVHACAAHPRTSTRAASLGRPPHRIARRRIWGARTLTVNPHLENKVDGTLATKKSRSELRGRRSWLLAAPGLLVLVLSYFPLLGLAVLSFSDQPMSGLPYPFTLAWYRHLLEDTRWVGPVRTSLVISTAVGIAAMLLATMMGRIIPRLQRSGAVLSAFILP